jgi:hypothetical protein
MVSGLINLPPPELPYVFVFHSNGYILLTNVCAKKGHIGQIVLVTVN